MLQKLSKAVVVVVVVVVVVFLIYFVRQRRSFKGKTNLRLLFMKSWMSAFSG